MKSKREEIEKLKEISTEIERNRKRKKEERK